MAPFIAMIMSIGITTLIGIAAFAFGTDSRPTYGDDHARLASDTPPNAEPHETEINQP